VEFTEASGSVSTNSAVRFNNAITAAGDLDIYGGGRLIVEGNATVAGTTYVQESSLIIGENNNGVNFTGNVSVGQAGDIGGRGNLTGNLTIENGGYTRPGNSPGTLSVDGDLLYEEGSFANFELGMPTSDLIDITGNLTFEGLSLQLAEADGLAIGTYTLYEYDGTLVGFDQIEVDNSYGIAAWTGFSGSLANDTTNKLINFSITSLGFAPIPEPSTLLLFMSSSLLFFRRRRR
jgi:hypothetical protein